MGSDDFDIRKFKFFALICGLFLISCWSSWQEFNYVVRGEVAEATVRHLRERGDALVVEFSYRDGDGRHWEERDYVWDNTELPREGGTIKIQYIPGTEDSARLAGQKQTGFVVFFFVCLGIMLFVGFRLWRMAHNAVHGGPKLAGSRR